jgi:plastocyanin
MRLRQTFGQLALQAAILCSCHIIFGCVSSFAAERRLPLAERSPSAEEVRIISTEFAFSVSPARIPAGRAVTIVLDNSQGETEHQIEFPGLGLRMFAAAGSSAKQTFTFEKTGDYEFVCNLPGHLEAGMKNKLTVVEASAHAPPKDAVAATKDRPGARGQ